jgi:L-cysteine desulfidase
MQKLKMRSLIQEVFGKEVKFAIGCTEVAAIGLVCSLALNAALENFKGGLKLKRKIEAKDAKKIKSVLLTLDPYLIKNAVGAGVPRSSGECGIKSAAALGLFGDPSRKLFIFDSVDENYARLVKQLGKTIRVQMKEVGNVPEIYAEAMIETANGWGRAVIQKEHENVVLVESNSGCYLKAKEAQKGSVEEYKEAFKGLTLGDIIDYVGCLPDGIRAIVKKGIDSVRDLSAEGLKRPLGIGVGYALRDDTEEIKNFIKMRTTSAIDSRMFGVPKPCVSVAGSGNQGIMTTMPINAYAEKVGLDEELLVCSVALSYLITIYASYYSSYLSAVCGLGSKAGVGSSAGLAYYASKGERGVVEMAIQNFIASIPGMVCDGAKYSCAIKGAIATDAVYQSVQLALKNREPPYENGILGKNVEESISNLGKIMKGAQPLNQTIVEIIKKRI